MMTCSRPRSTMAFVLFAVIVNGRLEAGAQKEGEHVIIEHPEEQFRIPDAKLPELKRRAEIGDMEAAMRLAAYYSLFLSNSEKRNRELEIHYYKIAAMHGSQAGIEMLIGIYSRSTDRFDLSKACYWRRALKRLATQRNIQVQSDAEWYYDLYSEYFVARRSVSSKRYKKLGLQFLECAARLGLKEAQRELTEIYSDDPEVREERKGIGPCICGELPTGPEPASSPKSAITPQGKN
jgi:TPR repeat protein